MPILSYAYAAIRRDEINGVEWIDHSTLSCDPVDARRKAFPIVSDPRGRLRTFLKENPMIRIGYIELKEVEERE